MLQGKPGARPSPKAFGEMMCERIVECRDVTLVSPRDVCQFGQTAVVRRFVEINANMFQHTLQPLGFSMTPVLFSATHKITIP
jgi:hypothetical protein